MALMQPQNSLGGANAGTAVPQNLIAPPQLNANAMNNSEQKAKLAGVPLAPSVTKAAANPNNKYYAKGGATPLPPSAPELKKELAKQSPASIPQVPASDLQPASPKGDAMENMFASYGTPEGKAMAADRAKMVEADKGYAKGGSVKPQNKGSGKDMSLKDIVKMLAAHPDVMGQSAGNAPATTPAMSTGGGIAPSQAGLLNMASGGAASDNLQEGSIQGYAPDGTPIVQGKNGGEEEANINDMLGRPSNAPTLGTGATPTSRSGETRGNASAANSLGGNGLMSQMMSKGGEEAGPPGANSNEVADNIPAQLSEGEFVFSADTTRFYGLRTLNMLQEHARQELAEMNNQGTIRHPGDGGDQQSGGQFLQDSKPNTNAYDDKDEDEEDDAKDQVSGLLKEAVNMATGGAASARAEPDEDTGTEGATEFTGGHIVGGPSYAGRSNAPNLERSVTNIAKNSPSHVIEYALEQARSRGATGEFAGSIDDAVKAASGKAKGGLVNMATGGAVAGEEQSLAGGGLVNSKMKTMFNKPSPNQIPSGEAKIPGLKKINATPKFAQGGLMSYHKD